MKKIIILLALTLFTVSGCGQKNQTVSTEVIEETILPLDEEIEDNSENDELITENEDKEVIEPATDKYVMPRNGSDKSSFSANGNGLLLITKDSDLNYKSYYAVKSETEFKETPFQIQENELLLKTCIGDDGLSYIITASAEKTKVDGVEILKRNGEYVNLYILDSTGNLSSTVDITDFYSKNSFKRCSLSVSEAGRIYLGYDYTIFEILSDGSYDKIIKTKDEIELIETEGEDIYATVITSDKTEKIVVYDEKFKEKETIDLPQYIATYYEMKKYEDALFIYNQEGGLFKCEGTEATNVATGNTLEISKQNVIGVGFLDDNYLCLLSQDAENFTVYVEQCGN